MQPLPDVLGRTVATLRDVEGQLVVGEGQAPHPGDPSNDHRGHLIPVLVDEPASGLAQLVVEAAGVPLAAVGRPHLHQVRWPRRTGTS